MKTKCFSFVFSLFITGLFCPSLLADNPPKKDQDTNTIVVGHKPFVEAGFYCVLILDETGELLYQTIAFIDSSTTLPQNDGTQVVLIPIDSK